MYSELTVFHRDRTKTLETTKRGKGNTWNAKGNYSATWSHHSPQGGNCYSDIKQTGQVNELWVFNSIADGLYNGGGFPFHPRIQEVCESRSGRPGLPILMSLVVSVDVKQHRTMLRHRSQFVPNTCVNPTSEDMKLYIIMIFPASLQSLQP